jgi:hypothetical protein
MDNPLDRKTWSLVIPQDGRRQIKLQAISSAAKVMVFGGTPFLSTIH